MHVLNLWTIFLQKAHNILHCLNFLPCLVQRLYNLGGRKFVIAGLGLMGCIPSILAQSSTGSCSPEVNQLILSFNGNVKTMLNNLNVNLPGSKFIFMDTAQMFQDILMNSRSYGNLTHFKLLIRKLLFNHVFLFHFPNCYRFQCDKPWMLWDRTEQRANYMPSVPNTVSKSTRVRLLGRIPPDSSGEHHNGQEGLQWGP